MNRPLAIMALFGLCLTSCSSSESAQQEVNTDESYGIVGFEDGSFIVQQFTLQSSESGKLNVGCYYDEKANYQCIGKGDTSDSSGKPIDLISTSLIAVIDANMHRIAICKQLSCLGSNSTLPHSIPMIYAIMVMHRKPYMFIRGKKSQKTKHLP